MKSEENKTLRKTYLDFLAVFLSTCFFSSYIPTMMMKWLPMGSALEYLQTHKRTGAGFVGSVCGIVTFIMLPHNWGNSLFLIFLGCVLALMASHRAEQIMNVKDDSRIVIDEWIGVWIAVWGLTPELSLKLVMGFILFRIFDVIKGPWGKFFQKLPGGWGIIMDDVMAGVLANVCLRVLDVFFQLS